MPLLLLLILLGYSLLLDLYPIVVASLMVFAMLLFSLAEHMKTGAYVIACGPLLLLLLKHKAIRSREYWISKAKSPDLILFSAMFFLLYAITRSYNCTIWDEFSHWILIVKNLHLNNKLPDDSSTVAAQFLWYSPGTPLFQYWATRIIGYGENNVIFAQALLLLSAFSTLFWKEKWADFNKAIIQFIAAISVLYLFNGSFTSLYVDAMLSVYFAMSIVLLFKLEKDDFIRTALTMMPVISMLFLIKAPGTLFAVLCSMIVVCFYIIDKNPITTFKKNFLLLLPLLLILSAGIYLPQVLWSWHMKDYGIKKEMPNIPMSQIIKSLTPSQSTAHDKETIKAFKTEIFSCDLLRGKILGGQGTFFASFILILLALTVTIIMSKDVKEKKRVLAANLVIFVGMVVYLIGLLILYLNIFVGVTVFVRYGVVYIRSWMLVQVFTAVAVIRTGNKLHWKYISLLAGALSLLTYFHVFKKQLFPEMRGRLHRYAEYFQTIDPSKKVYFIYNGSDGFEYWVFRYEMAPVHIQTNGPWSIGLSKYGPDDLWTAVKDANSWAQDLKDFDYLVVAKSDEKFWTTYASLFQNAHSDGIYEITHIKNRISLLPLKTDK